jgi:tetraacyldisaccharide 4'-kinase
MSLDAALQRLWYGPRWASLPLWPLSWLFRAVVALRRTLYQRGLLHPQSVAVPVVVVGNLTVGGTGKTPVSAWLAQEFARRGRRVGVVLRGYGGQGISQPVVVTSASNPADVGDEALLHALRGPQVVVAGADRVAAARLAVERGADIIVCDDGLQHLRLARDVEIAVVDAERGLGNGMLLPAGPLREPAARLANVYALVLTDRGSDRARKVVERPPRTVTARLRSGEAVNLRSGERRALAGFRNAPVHTVAGIGHPQAFFDSLRDAGLDIEVHAIGDHVALDPDALPFPHGATVLMTEKDAVKCRGFAEAGWWFVELEVFIGDADAAALIEGILERAGLPGAGERRG